MKRADMPNTLTLDVTQSHINRGIPYKMQLCPIALAMKARGFKTPVVGHTWIWLHNSGDKGKPVNRYKGNPVDVRYYPVGSDRNAMETFATDFNEGVKVEPITLTFKKS